MLGGHLMVRNAVSGDYCVEAAVRSLMGVCDEIAIVDAYSDDGTWEMLNLIMPDFKGLWTLTQTEWKPSMMGGWLSSITNYARQLLHTPIQICLQADEVIHEDDYPIIRKLAETGGTYTVERLNFYYDHRHILQPEVKIGQRIVRLAPITVPSIGDAQGLGHHGKHSNVRLFHYSFVRDHKKLAAKSRPMHEAYYGGGYDPIIDAIESEGLKALIDYPRFPTAVPLSELVEYHGSHPRAVHKWLKEHGYDL